MLSQNWVISECHDKLDFRGRDWGWDGVEIGLLMFKTTLWQITINIPIVITVLSIGEGSWGPPHLCVATSGNPLNGTGREGGL